jgi:hypothetical protein
MIPKFLQPERVPYASIEMESLMRVVCGWCASAMGEKPGLAGAVSHGLCASCAATLHGELDVLEVETTIEDAARLRRVA